MKKTTLCDEFQRLSVETWDRIGFARSRSGLKIYETTITQNLLFQLKKFSELYKTTQVQMFEAVNEKTNGNDIEIFLQIDSDYICLPTQAKIIYSNGKYPRMEHGKQINDLMNYAKSVGGFPLYLLYNYDKENISLNNYGCSIVSAQYLFDNFAYKLVKKKWIIPSFSDLNPSVAEPWDVLVCNFFSNILTTMSRSLIASDISAIKNYAIEEVVDNSNWKRLTLVKSDREERDDLSETNYDNEFSPKFRIVISSQNIGKK